MNGALGPCYLRGVKTGADTLVRIDVELKVKDGEVIESSKKSGPVEYRHGTGKMLPGLEKVLDGLEAGAEKSGTIAAKDAFGTLDDQPKMSIPRTNFPKDAKIAKGSKFEAKSPTGAPVTLEVLSVDDETITARMAHPLAGKEIEYTVKVVSVRKAPPPVPVSKSAAPASVRGEEIGLEDDAGE